MKGNPHELEHRLQGPPSPSFGGPVMAEAVLAAAIALTPVSAAQAAHIPPSQQAFADCVSHRESRDNYRARNDESSARGRWQFLDRKWRNGLAYMVTDRLHDFGMSRAAAKHVRIHLQSLSIDRWDPTYQDIAFTAVLNARGPWSGWRHWYLPGSKCNALVGKR